METRSPPAFFETYMPASATRMMSSAENPCTGKVATPKLPVMWCSLNIGSVATQSLRRSARICACSTLVSGISITNSSPPYRNHIGLTALLFEQSAYARQHQVTFHVSKGIVHFLKLIQI